MRTKLKVAAAQLTPRPGDLAGNLRKAEELIQSARSQGAEVICFPELFDHAYDLEAIARMDSAGEETDLFLSRLAREQQIHIISGGVKMDEEGERLNVSTHFVPSGQRGEYAKIHLFDLDPVMESHTFHAGRKRALWDIEGISVAPLICYDLRFPELARALALDGARVLFLSSAWPAQRAEVLRALSQARAIENQLYLVSANQVGEYKGMSFAGHSMIVAPNGKILEEANGAEEALLLQELDFSFLEELRQKMPCLEQRRPEIYK